jgi:hypothetical protein
MPKTGNKFNDLFQLSKQLQPRQDKTPVDLDFDKSRDQCTFHPSLQASQPSLLSQSKSVCDIRGLQKVQERMQRGRDEREWVAHGAF